MVTEMHKGEEEERKEGGERKEVRGEGRERGREREEGRKEIWSNKPCLKSACIPN